VAVADLIPQDQLPVDLVDQVAVVAVVSLRLVAQQQ
jgi:hypothetical protein